MFHMQRKVLSLPSAGDLLHCPFVAVLLVLLGLHVSTVLQLDSELLALLLSRQICLGVINYLLFSFLKPAITYCPFIILKKNAVHAT